MVTACALEMQFSLWRVFHNDIYSDSGKHWPSTGWEEEETGRFCFLWHIEEIILLEDVGRDHRRAA